MEDVSSFPVGSIRFGVCNSSLLLPEYRSSAMNVLRSSPKLSDLTKNDFLKLKLTKTDKKVGEK